MVRRAIFTTALLAGVLATGCSKKVDDAGLATQVKSEMFSDPQLNGASLEVTSKNGQVTLSGIVPNDAARYRAYKIANETAGVMKVDDQMTVLASTPPSTQVAATGALPPGPAKSPPERLEKPRKAQKSSSSSPPDTNPESADGAVLPSEQPQAMPPVAAQVQPVAAQASAAPQPALPQPPPEPQPPQPKQISIPADSMLTVRMIDGVDSAVNNAGEIFHASLEAPLVVGDDVVVPRGTDIYVRLVNASSAGRMSGKSQLHLELVKMEFQGRSYPLVSSTYSVSGSSRGKNTAAKVGGGAALGAIIGAIAGGGKGAGIGAGVGAAGGAIYQGATKGKQVKIPAEARLDFQLEQPVTVFVMPRPSNSAEGQQ